MLFVDAIDRSDGKDGSFELKARIIGLMADLCRDPLSKLRFIVLDIA
jgi:hypothetical protein